MRKEECFIDDVCAEIGFTATIKLMRWHGGRNIYVPDKANPDHPLAQLIGMPALIALCENFGSCTMWIPTHLDEPRMETTKAIARHLAAGKSVEETAKLVCMTVRSIQRTRKSLINAGILAAPPSKSGTRI